MKALSGPSQTNETSAPPVGRVVPAEVGPPATNPAQIKKFRIPVHLGVDGGAGPGEVTRWEVKIQQLSRTSAKLLRRNLGAWEKSAREAFGLLDNQSK